MRCMILYHGSNALVKKPEICENLRALDFGAGFYLTSSREQAVKWARTVTRRRRKGNPVLKEAVRSFIKSETYQMLLDVELDIYKMSPLIVFDMWESEKITGDPRNSQYIRE